MRSLKRRLQHKNPNVQLAALSVSGGYAHEQGRRLSHSLMDSLPIHVSRMLVMPLYERLLVENSWRLLL